MPDPDIAQSLDRLLRRVHAGLGAVAPRYDAHAIGPGGGMVLMTLADMAPAPIHMLVARMARDKSQITRTLKMLDAKGLIAREMSDEDARVCVVDLTPKGHQTVASLRAALSEVTESILAPLTPDERAALQTLLLRVAE